MSVSGVDLSRDIIGVGRGRSVSSVGRGRSISSVGGGRSISSVGRGRSISSVGRGGSISSVGRGRSISSVGRGRSISSVGRGRSISSIGRGRSIFGIGRGRQISGLGRSRSGSFVGLSVPVSSVGRGRGLSSGHSVGQSSGSSLPIPLSGSWAKTSPTSLQYNRLVTPGPTLPIGNSCSARELFERFFTQEAWDLLVQETNRYANLVTGSTPNSRPWNGTNVEEMKAFIGIIIYMGIIKLPRLELYWSKQYNGIETPGIARVMPLVRFEQLFRCFHVSNNVNQIPYGQPGHDKLFKIRSLLDVVVPHFQNEYSLRIVNQP